MYYPGGLLTNVEHTEYQAAIYSNTHARIANTGGVDGRQRSDIAPTTDSSLLNPSQSEHIASSIGTAVAPAGKSDKIRCTTTMYSSGKLHDIEWIRTSSFQSEFL